MICKYLLHFVLNAHLFLKFSRRIVQQWWEKVQSSETCNRERNYSKCWCHLLYLCWCWWSTVGKFQISPGWKLFLIFNFGLGLNFVTKKLKGFLHIFRSLSMSLLNQLNLNVSFPWSLEQNRYQEILHVSDVLLFVLNSSSDLRISVIGCACWWSLPAWSSNYV